MGLKWQQRIIYFQKGKEYAITIGDSVTLKYKNYGSTESTIITNGVITNIDTIEYLHLEIKENKLNKFHSVSLDYVEEIIKIEPGKREI